MSTLSELIPALLEKTQQKKLNWHIDENDELWVKIDKAIITVNHGISERIGKYYNINIRNPDGIVIDTKDVIEGKNDDLEVLYKNALSNTLRFDEILTNVLQTLKTL